MTKKLTIEYCKEIALREGYEIRESEYINATTPMTFFHLDCQRESEKRWSDFNTGTRCKYCSIERVGFEQRWKIEDCIEIANNRGFEILDEEYLNNKEPIRFRHVENDCNFEFSMPWNEFMKGKYGCKKCSGLLSPTIEFCKEESLKRGYILLEEEYINVSTPMQFFHPRCGTYFKTRWGNFHTSKTECKVCSMKDSGAKQRLTIEYCKQKAKEQGYRVNDDVYFSASDHYLNFTHLECGFDFPMKWGAFHSGERCPQCSRKESSVARELKGYYGINFGAIPEYKIVRNPETNWFLPYDVFIPRYNNDGYDIFIEVHGEQHYRFDHYYHKTLDDFEYRQYKDKIKKDYAEQNGIYIEIDLRQKTPIEDIIEKINNTITRYG